MSGVRSAIDFIADIWRETRRFFVVLWLCRISTASAVLALVLAFLPQVQDLYTEITFYSTPSTENYLSTIKYWFTFYSLCFLWAFTVHYCARTVLSFETWPLSRKDEQNYQFWIEFVPRLLGWVCIIAIFIGQINALKNLQIDDQLLNNATTNKFITPLIFVLCMLILVQLVSRRMRKSILIISDIAILYWLIAAAEVYFQTRLAEHYRIQMFHNLILPVVTILWGVIFYYFVAKRRPLLSWLSRLLPWPHHFMLHITRHLSEFFPIQIRPMHNQQTRSNSPKFFPFRKRGLFHFEAPSENVRGLMLGLFALTIVMIIWAMFAINDPANPPFGLNRALLLPVLLCIWVPLLTTVTFLSNQLRFPFLTSFIILGLTISWVVGDNHDVELTELFHSKTETRVTEIHKTISDDEIVTGAVSSAIKQPAETPPAPTRKLALKKAVEIWMQHHNCEQTPRACPAPIIIAASGGASRSAFYVSTVLGKFHDNPELFWPKQIPQNRRPKTATDVAKQIFAISSVSGGSLGSGIYAASLRGTTSNLFSTLPCKGDVLRRDKLLFSVPESNLEKTNYPANWKNCLQGSASGDFLSPAMISFTFRDNLAFSSMIGLLTKTDRAKSLEEAWVNRTKTLTGRPHLEDPLLTFQPTRNNWMPLLILNGTSVTTGKRLIATPLKTTYALGEKINFAPYLASADINPSNKKIKTAIFRDSLDLHELLAHQAKQTISTDIKTRQTNWDKNQSQTMTPDIALSKAISLSARFPLISPHGNLRNQDGNIIDRVVDGGYFDNSGMLSAMELAKAIEVISNKALKPILIQISNHPVTLNQKSFFEKKNGKFSCPENSFINHARPPAQHQILPELNAVTSALLNARVARGSHAITHAAIDYKHRFVHFQVAGIKDELGSSKKLSMSWWLSKSVQNALNNQMNWKRDTPEAKNLPIRERLNPSFCAIRKFRNAQIRHWKSQKHNKPDVQSLNQ